MTEYPIDGVTVIPYRDAQIGKPARDGIISLARCKQCKGPQSFITKGLWWWCCSCLRQGRLFI